MRSHLAVDEMKSDLGTMLALEMETSQSILKNWFWSVYGNERTAVEKMNPFF